MTNEEDESLVSLGSDDCGDNSLIGYISSQKSEINDSKRRKLDSFVLNITKSSKQVKNDLIWSIKYIPQTTSELTIHPKKIKDLRSKLHDIIYKKTNKRVLIVNGPSGCGKNICVKLLCDEIMKEKNEKSRDLSLGNDRLDNLIEFSYLTNSDNSVEYFSHFLDECKMLTGANEKCVIIKELPNIYHKQTHINFQNSVLKWIETSMDVDLPPLIICVTEYDIENEHRSSFFNIENTFKVETVFGNKIMGYENVAWERVTFNPVAKTYMKKAIMNIINKEEIQRDAEFNSKIDDICQLGDLRNGINVLEYYEKFFRGIPGNEILSKESGLDLFHSIGKLIYGSKHQEVELVNFKKRLNLNRLLTGGSELDMDADLITSLLVSDDISNSLTKVNLCCLENYKIQSGNGEVNEGIFDMINNWSMVDTMIRRSSNEMTDNLSLFSCLSTRVSMSKCSDKNRSSSHSKMIFSSDSKVMRKKRLVQYEINEYLQRRRNRLLKSKDYNHLTSANSVLYDGFYQSLIMGSFKQRQMRFMNGSKAIKISRLGGDFNAMQSGNEFEVIDLRTVEDEYYGKLDDDDEEEEDNFDDDPLEDSEDEFSDDDVIPKVEYPDDTFSDDDL